jgi:predicted TIM-barrel fold metal-dependent hydrolase
MIIDMHTHAFGENIARRTMEKLEQVVGNPPAYDGTITGLKGAMAKAGVDHALMLVIATKPSQHGTINAWAAAQNEGNITAFGSVHPDCEDVYTELLRIKALGLKGIKIHPDYQATDSDDPKYHPIYEGAQELGLICLFHCGIDSVSPHYVHNTPQQMAKILRDFPRLKVIGGHLGGLLMWDEVEEHLMGKNIYIETSLCHRGLAPERLRRILDGHDPERVLFGSDSPWAGMAESIDYIRSLKLPADREERLFSGNARALLGL